MKRPVIYVNRITSLSDARYCAGMGADMLGFVVNPDHEDYVSPVQFKEIMEWVSGPRSVVEIVDWPSVDVNEVIALYHPDVIHISTKSVTLQTFPDISLILEPTGDGWLTLIKEIPRSLKIEFIAISKKAVDSPVQWSEIKYPTLLSYQNDVSAITKVLEETGAEGFMLQGSREIKPGLKDYDQLSNVLEALDSLF